MPPCNTALRNIYHASHHIRADRWRCFRMVFRSDRIATRATFHLTQTSRRDSFRSHRETHVIVVNQGSPIMRLATLILPTTGNDGTDHTDTHAALRLMLAGTIASIKARRDAAPMTDNMPASSAASGPMWRAWNSPAFSSAASGFRADINMAILGIDAQNPAPMSGRGPRAQGRGNAGGFPSFSCF